MKLPSGVMPSKGQVEQGLTSLLGKWRQSCLQRLWDMTVLLQINCNQRLSHGITLQILSLV